MTAPSFGRFAARRALTMPLRVIEIRGGLKRTRRGKLLKGAIGKVCNISPIGGNLGGGAII